MEQKPNTGMTYTSHGKRKALGKLVKVGEDERTALAYVEKDNVVGYEWLDNIVKDSYTKEIPHCDVDF